MVGVGAEAFDARDFAGVQVFFQPLDEAVEGRFRGVGDEAGDRVVQIVFHRLEHARNDGAAQGFPLSVNVGVVSAREVDAFEAARLPFACRTDFFEVGLPVALNDQGRTGIHFSNLVGRHIEGGLDDGALRGSHHHFVVFVPVGRTNAIGIAHHKGVSVPCHAAHDVASVKVGGGASQHVAHVEGVRDAFGDALVVQPFGLQCFKPPLIFLVEEVANLFQDRDGVGLLLGVLAELDKHVKKFVDVGEVEVAGHHEVSGAPIALAQEGVAVFNLVFPKGAVAQVAQEQLAGEGKVVLQSNGVLELFRCEVLETPHDLFEEILDGASIHGSHARDVTLSGVDVEFDVGQTGAVLPAVVLLFHQQVHFVQPVEGRAVLVDVVLKGLLEAQHRNAALMLERVAHGRWQS